jgi:hypothetical protein
MTIEGPPDWAITIFIFFDMILFRYKGFSFR